MYLVPLLLGPGLILLGLALATDHRVSLNGPWTRTSTLSTPTPASCGPSTDWDSSIQGWTSSGTPHSSGGSCGSGVGFSPSSDLRSWPQASCSWFAPDRCCASYGTSEADASAFRGEI